MGVLRCLLLLACFGNDVSDLGSDSFAARERAEARLSRWALVAEPLLRLPSGDLERRTRASRILAGAVPQHPPSLLLLAAGPNYSRGWVGPNDKLWMDPYRPAPGWRLTSLQIRHGEPMEDFLMALGMRGGLGTGRYATWIDYADGVEPARALCRNLAARGVPLWALHLAANQQTGYLLEVAATGDGRNGYLAREARLKMKEGR